MKGGRGEDPRGDRSVKCGGESFLLQLSDVPTDYICSPSSGSEKRGFQAAASAGGRSSLCSHTNTQNGKFWRNSSGKAPREACESQPRSAWKVSKDSRL